MNAEQIPELCSHKMTEKRTNYIADLETCIVIVRGVPSFVCEECQETYYATSVAKRLEEIVEAAKAAMTEIAVVHYSEKIA